MSTRKSFKKVTHCIFDMDGLLLDTEKLYSEAAQQILDPYGKTYTFQVKQEVMGLQTRPVAEAMVKTYNLPISWQEYAEQQRNIAKSLMINSALMPDTEKIYEEVTRQIAGAFGKKYPIDVRFKLLGTTERRSAEIAVSECDIPITVDKFLARYNKSCRQLLTNVHLLKGAERLLRHLNAHKIPFALATSSGEDMVDLKTTNHRELFKLFKHTVCGSTDKEVKEGKPAPDIFLVAASRFLDSPDPSDCLVFEDSPNGVLAARAAGMQVVMVPDPRLSEERLANATHIISSLEVFKPEQFGLPPFVTEI